MAFARVAPAVGSMFVLIRWRFFLLSEGGNSYSDATKIKHEQSRNRSLEVRASWNQLQENKEESCDLFLGAIEVINVTLTRVMTPV